MRPSDVEYSIVRRTQKLHTAPVKTSLPETPAPDDFRALARSSPWRFRTLHWTHYGAGAHNEDRRVEAWLRRPGHLTVRDASGVRIATGVPHAVTTMWFTSATEAEAAAGAGSSTDWSAVDEPHAPWFRPDGLVAVRPVDYHLTHGDPMWQSYFWTAMLDPEELSHDVDITDVYAADRLGRPTWWATASTTPDYDPRCDCCALLNDQGSIQLVERLFDDGERRERGWETYSDDVPTAHLVGLDVQTGIVVDITELDGSCDTWVSNEIHAVDEELHPPAP